MDHRPYGRRLASTRVLKPAAIFGVFILLFCLGPADAKTPGKTYCFLGVCHRVKTIAETERAIGVNVIMKASHYDDPKRDRFNPSRITSSGEFLRADHADNAASPSYPDGTKLLVWNPRTKQALVVRINNAGPYYGSRLLDLSRGAAEKLGFAREGVSTVYAKVIAAPTVAEASYRYARTYAPVPGPIGAFESIDTALLDLGRAINNLFPSPVFAVAGREPPTTTGRVLVAQRPVRQSPRALAQARKQAPVVAEAQPAATTAQAPGQIVAQARQAPEPVARPTGGTRVASVQSRKRPVAVARASSESRTRLAQAPSRQQVRTASIDEDDDEAISSHRERGSSGSRRANRVVQAQTRASRRADGDTGPSYSEDSYQIRLDRGA